MCFCNSLLGGLSMSCVTSLGKDSWILALDFPGLGPRPVLLCTYPFILTHHSHDCEYMKIPIANHWVWEWSWGPSPTTQSAKIVVFALKRDGTVGITQLLKVSLNYLLLSLKSLGWEPQMFSGPHEHSQSATPSPPNQDSNVFPRRGKRRREGRVDTESGEPDVDQCPSLPGAEVSVIVIGKHGQFKGIWKQRTWISSDGLWGGPKTQGGVGRRGLGQTGLTQPCLWIRQKTMPKQSFFLFIWLCWVFVAAHGLSLVAVNGGYSLVVECGFLIVVASLLVEHRFLGMWASVVAARRLSSYHTWA